METHVWFFNVHNLLRDIVAGDMMLSVERTPARSVRSAANNESGDRQRASPQDGAL